MEASTIRQIIQNIIYKTTITIYIIFPSICYSQFSELLEGDLALFSVVSLVFFPPLCIYLFSPFHSFFLSLSSIFNKTLFINNKLQWTSYCWNIIQLISNWKSGNVNVGVFFSSFFFFIFRVGIIIEFLKKSLIILTRINSNGLINLLHAILC